MLRNKDGFMVITIVLVIITVALYIWDIVSKQTSEYTFSLLGLILISSGASALRSGRRVAAYANWIVGIFILIVFALSI